MKRRSTTLVNLGIAALIVLVVAAGFIVTGSAENATDEPSTTTVRTGDVTQSVSAAGTVEAPDELAVSFESSGELIEVDVEVGDIVEEGDVLGKVDPTDAQRSLENAQAGLVTAQSQLAQTLQTLTPAEQAQQDVDAEQSGLQTAQARTSLQYTEQLTALNAQSYQTQVDQARAALSRAEDDLTSAQEDLSDAEDQQAVDQAEQAVDQADSAVTQAQEQVVAATENQATNLVRDQQTLAQARQQVETAQLQEASSAAQRSVQAEAPQDYEVASAQAGVDRAEIDVATAQESLDDTVLHAPVSGLVTEVNGSVGGQAGSTGSSTSNASTTAATGATSSTTAATGATSSSSSSGSSFVTIVPSTGVEATASFAEVDAIEIDPGQPVVVTFDALPDLSIDATVTAVSPTASVTDNVVTYEVRVLIEDVPDGVRAGMSATVEVIVGEATGVLILPSSAITSVGDQSTVTVLRDGEEQVVTVEVGLRGSGSVEVTGDLEEGDEVLLTTGSATGLGGDSGELPFGGGAPPGGLGGGGP